MTAYVQDAHSTSATPAITGVTAGNFLGLGFTMLDNGTGVGAPTITSIADSTGDSWAQAAQQITYSGTIGIWYDTHTGGASAGTHTLTITWSASVASATFDFTLVEYSGVQTGTSLDVSNATYCASAATVNLSTGAVAASGELGILYAGAAGNSDWPLVSTAINGSAPTQRSSVTLAYGCNSYWADTLSLPSGTQTAQAVAQSGASYEFGAAFAAFKTSGSSLHTSSQTAAASFTGGMGRRTNVTLIA